MPTCSVPTSSPKAFPSAGASFSPSPVTQTPALFCDFQGTSGLSADPASGCANLLPLWDHRQLAAALPHRVLRHGSTLPTWPAQRHTLAQVTRAKLSSRKEALLNCCYCITQSTKAETQPQVKRQHERRRASRHFLCASSVVLLISSPAHHLSCSLTKFC